MLAVEIDHSAGQQPLQALGERSRPRAHQEVDRVRHEGAGVQGQVPPWHNAANRVTTSARSVSAGTSFVRSLPRPMTWCRIPGASKRGGLGMRRHCRLPLQESSCFRTYVPHYPLQCAFHPPPLLILKPQTQRPPLTESGHAGGVTVSAQEEALEPRAYRSPSKPHEYKLYQNSGRRFIVQPLGPRQEQSPHSSRFSYDLRCPSTHGSAIRRISISGTTRV